MKKGIFQLFTAGLLALAFSSAHVSADHDVFAPEKHVLDMRGTISISTFTTINDVNATLVNQVSPFTVHNACTTIGCTTCCPSYDPIVAVNQFRLRGKGFSIGSQTIVDTDIKPPLCASGIDAYAARAFTIKTQILFDIPFDLPPTIVGSIENDGTVFATNCNIESILTSNSCDAALLSFTFRASQVTTTGFVAELTIIGVGCNTGAIYHLLQTYFCGPNSNINFIAEAPNTSAC